MFKYDRFLQLQGSELCDYMEPLLQQESLPVGRDVLARMLEQLPKFDKFHLVYALEIGARCAPDMFLIEIPRYLVHPKGSVWSAAYRILNRLPADKLSQRIVNQLEQLARENPTNEILAELLAKVRNRRYGQDGATCAPE